MRTSRALLASLLLVVPVATPLACGGKTSNVVPTADGGDGDTGAPTVGAVPREQFDDAFIHAVCDNAGDCCRSNGLGYDAAACVSHMKAENSSDPQLASAHYDADAAGRCVAAVKSAAARCAPYGVYDRSCFRVFTGDGAPGAPCKSLFDCAAAPTGTADIRCSGDFTGRGDAGPSHCIVMLDPQEGERCGDPAANTTSACDGDGWQCDFSGSTGGVCHARKAFGEACDAHGDQCVDGLICIGGTCVDGKPIGAACVGSECAAGATCDFGSNVCVATLSLGAACTNNPMCQSGLCDSIMRKCVSSLLATPPICVTG